MTAPTHILLVEDSRAFAGLAAHALTSRLGAEVSVATTLAEAERILAELGDSKVLVVTGLSLADGNDTEVVRFFAGRGHAPIVLTGVYDEAVRDRILSMPVVDYVLKDSPGCIDTLVALVRRVWRNHGITALVVEDSTTMRRQLAALLTLSGFHVLTAADGVAGLEQMRAHPAIRLVLVDYAMPRLDGIEMIRELRRHHPREDLAIIGLSGKASDGGGGSLSARFLKSGANDFLIKPFEREELDCRIDQNVEMLESFARLKEMAAKDFLTGLSNRRHFFTLAEPMIGTGRAVTAAMLDVDHFKRINDRHGHDAGDAVLKRIADTLAAQLRQGDLLARFGGEEFCMLLPDLPREAATAFFERLRGAIAALAVPVAGETVRLTCSIGVAFGPTDSLDRLLGQADTALYRAKTNGRDRVELAET
jgi:diguanylate cyclase (GGDEF)-like protein